MSPTASRLRHHLDASTAAITAASTLTTAKRQQHSKSSLISSSSKSSSPSSLIAQTFEPTISNKYLLPKQPLPDLNATLNRYLNSLRPLLIVDQTGREKLKYTEECVRRFVDASGIHNGHILQDILYERARARDNWALEKNIDQYLTDTSSVLPIHSNPAKVMKPLKFEDENAYLSYVTRLVKAIHQFKTKIDTNTLEVDRCNAYEKGQPMCMEQYTNLFGSYRAPGVERDSFRVYNDDLSNQFITVMSRGQLFKVNLIVNSNMVSDLELFHQLSEIRRITETTSADPREDLGYLTSLPRQEWARIRQSLIKNPINARSLDLIERSSFMICLDEKVDSHEFPNEDIKSGLQLLHGSGVQYNSRNRWHDKTLQFVISEDGVNGLVREHSPSEGPITVNLINHVYKYLKSSNFFDSFETYPYSEPERLEWSLTDEHVEKVNEARQRHDQNIKNFDLNIFKYEKFGRSYPKMFNMSPDSFFQVCYQLAYFRMYGRLPVQGSFGSQRRFYRGRSDYIRAPSIDSLNFCIAMNSPSTSMNERFYLLEKAVETQTRIMVETILGNGFDCHMFTLKKLAKELNGDLPDVFKDPSFEFNTTFQFLTSQVTTSDDGTFSCFSPSHKVGYGSSYNLKPDHILFTMSAYKSAKSNSISCMSDSLVDTLDQVFEICQHRSFNSTVHHSNKSNERK